MKLHRVAATIDIARPLNEVFAFYADFTHRPSFIEDIVAVWKLEPGVTCRTIEGLLGSHVHVPVKVTELRANRLIRYRSCNRRSASARWQVRFRPIAPSVTRVEEELLLPLSMLGRWSSKASVPGAALTSANANSLERGPPLA